MTASKKEKSIIEVKHLSKQYNIGTDRTYKTLSESLSSAVRCPVTTLKSGFKQTNTFWALKDVNFNVERGEVVGIIGRNGAGKSTLLKILSRITYPTDGEVRMRGRVGSLLEVGTGFHPELTGRENIYFNGSILGMKKKEIDDKFDDIVKFSGIGKFLDTPVKRYSSGMSVRLGFSVAAHLDPEILIVDEVLAVGDAAFQKKCLGKLGEVSESGKTVLFVSHNMGFVAQLCERCIQFSHGVIVADGEPRNIIENYLSSECNEGRVDLREWAIDRTGNGSMRITYVETLNSDKQVKTQFAYGEEIVFNIGISGNAGTECILGVSIRNTMGQLILHLSNTDDKAELLLPSNESEIHLSSFQNILNDGTYYVTVWLGDHFNILHDRVGNCLSFEINSSMIGSFKSQGMVRLPAKWTIT